MTDRRVVRGRSHHVLTWLARRFPLLACLLWTADVAAGGQTPSRFAMQFSYSHGTGKGGEFSVPEQDGLQLAVSARHRNHRMGGTFVEFAYEFLDYSQHTTSDCRFDSHGNCLKGYPLFAGPTIGGGIILSPGSETELRLSAGAGAYHARDGGDRTGAFLAQFDVAGFPVGHFGYVLGIRRILIPSYRSERLWQTPVMVGVRVR